MIQVDCKPRICSEPAPTKKGCNREDQGQGTRNQQSHEIAPAKSTRYPPEPARQSRGIIGRKEATVNPERSLDGEPSPERTQGPRIEPQKKKGENKANRRRRKRTQGNQSYLEEPRMRNRGHSNLRSRTAIRKHMESVNNLKPQGKRLRKLHSDPSGEQLERKEQATRAEGAGVDR